MNQSRNLLFTCGAEVARATPLFFGPEFGMRASPLRGLVFYSLIKQGASPLHGPPDRATV